VGTIVTGSRRAAGGAVHPHGRGDNTTTTTRSGGSSGSPPRAWGQCVPLGCGACCSRFTPTGVGTILTRTPIPLSTSVHPHGRGDNARGVGAERRKRGSPPRAWGQSI